MTANFGLRERFPSGMSFDWYEQKSEVLEENKRLKQELEEARARIAYLESHGYKSQRINPARLRRFYGE